MATSSDKLAAATATQNVVPASSTTLFAEAMSAVDALVQAVQGRLPLTLYHDSDPRVAKGKPWPGPLKQLLQSTWGLCHVVVEVVATESKTTDHVWMVMDGPDYCLVVKASTEVAFLQAYQDVRREWLTRRLPRVTHDPHLATQLRRPLLHWLQYEPWWDRQVLWFANNVRVLGCETAWACDAEGLSLAGEHATFGDGHVTRHTRTPESHQRAHDLRETLKSQQRCSAVDRFPAAVSRTDSSLHPVQVAWPHLLCSIEEGGTTVDLTQPQRWQFKDRIHPSARLLDDLLGLAGATLLSTRQKGKVVHWVAQLSPPAAALVARTLISPPIKPAPAAWRFRYVLDWHLDTGELQGALFTWPADSEVQCLQGMFETMLRVLVE